MRWKFGFLVNPIAGVGAELAWKGTDDVQRAWKVVEKGAKQPALSTVLRLDLKRLDAEFFVTSLTPDIGTVVYTFPERSNRQDTIHAVKKFIGHNVDLVIFVGGDGTARDIASVSGETPIIGVPGGVKIFSGTFVHRAEDLIPSLQRWSGESMEVEVLDLDEEAYKEGHAAPKLFGITKVPVIDSLQKSKEGWGAISDQRVLEMLAERIQDNDWLDSIIAVGPGGTTHSIFMNLGLEKTLLGVDVYDHGKLLVTDATAEQLEDLPIDEIWITPIGRQGHIFGRGNKQLTATLIRKVGLSHIRIFATPEKMQGLPTLYVDTGDPNLDQELHGYVRVYISYSDSVVRKVT